MTRITDFGRKRTYLEAGFNFDCAKDASSLDHVDAVETGLSDGARPKKRKKGDSKCQSQKILADTAGIGAEGVAEAEKERVNDVPDDTIPSTKSLHKKKGKAQLSKGQSARRYCGHHLLM